MKLLFGITVLCLAMLTVHCRRVKYKTPAASCDVHQRNRTDCGWPGITPDECEERDCCFNNYKWKTIWCFFPRLDLSGDSVKRSDIIKDPHITTLDGKHYDYQGICTHFLADTVLSGGSGLTAFSVQGLFVHRYGATYVSWLDEMDIEIGTDVVSLRQGPTAFLNGGAVFFPSSLAPGLQLLWNGAFVRLQTSFGLAVEFDGNAHGVIFIPEAYMGQINGLVGNFDGDPTNDPDENTADQWMDPACFAGSKSGVVPSRVRRQAVDLCAPLLESPGPFNPYNSDPANAAHYFYASCGVDVAALERAGADAELVRQTACGVMASFMKHVGPITTATNWRRATGCELPCPDNSHYEELASPCIAIYNETAPERDNCALPPTEGCFCDPCFEYHPPFNGCIAACLDSE